MSNPEDKKTSKPPGDEPPSGYMSPKLRSKMLPEDETQDTSNSNVANIIGIVMLVAIVLLSAFFWISYKKSQAEEKQKATTAAKLAAEEARTDSLNKAVQDAIQKARSDSLAAIAAKNPKPKPAATPSATPGGQAAAGGQTATPPPPASKFGIDVGSFLSQDRANSELAKLQGSTSLSGHVVPRSEDGGTSYHVVIGEFTSRKDAETKANALIVASTIREATVTKLK